MGLTALATTKRLLSLPVLLLLGTGNILYGVSKSVRIKGSATDEPQEVRLRVQRQKQTLNEFIATQKQELVATTGKATKTETKRLTEKEKKTDAPAKKSLNELHAAGKPYLILHVGPLHTFANELQTQLKGISEDLAHDNFVLADETTQDLVTDFDCHKKLNRARRSYVTQQTRGKIEKGTTFSDYILSQVTCWQSAMDNLESYRKNGQSVIISTEKLSTQWTHFEDLTLAPMDWLALETTLSSLFNIELVVGYRRYAEWLPEAIQAYTKANYAPELILHPSEEKDQPATTMREPLVPNIVHHAAKDSAAVENSINTVYTQTMLERLLYRETGKTKIPVSLLNVHERANIVQTFACDILVDASHACSTASKRSVQQRPISEEPAQMYDFYNLLVEYGASHGIFPAKKISRQTAVIGTRYHHEKVLKKGVADLPIRCPKENHARTLLNVSLRYESDLLPGFAQSHSGDHRTQFWKLLRDTKLFCSVDPKKVFKDRKWRSLLRNLPKKVPTEYLPEIQTQPPKPKKNPGAITKEYKKGKKRGRVTTIRMRRSATG